MRLLITIAPWSAPCRHGHGCRIGALFLEEGPIRWCWRPSDTEQSGGDTEQLRRHGELHQASPTSHRCQHVLTTVLKSASAGVDVLAPHVLLDDADAL